MQQCNNAMIVRHVPVSAGSPQSTCRGLHRIAIHFIYNIILELVNGCNRNGFVHLIKKNETHAAISSSSCSACGIMASHRVSGRGQFENLFVPSLGKMNGFNAAGKETRAGCCLGLFISLGAKSLLKQLSCCAPRAKPL